jgi:molybdate transport system substrate-binding protein
LDAATTPGRTRRRLPALLLLALSAPGLAAVAADQPGRVADARPAPLVAAASDLQYALDQLLAAFRHETGIDVRVAYGSSGNFARQIEQGAPFELFLSADEAFVERLARRGLTQDRGVLYAVGRLVLYVPRGSPLQPDPQLRGLARYLGEGGAGRIAIANPEHAPYGRAAEQLLRQLGLWEAAAPRLVLGENVAQAAQFASSGNVDGALLAYSLALAPPLRDRGAFVLLPESLHAPLRQRMVLMTGASAGAASLYEYLQTPPARAILASHGFALPAE